MCFLIPYTYVAPLLSRSSWLPLVCYLYMCLLSIVVIFTIVLYFLDSTYMISYSIYLSLTYFTKHNTPIHVVANGKELILFYFLNSIPLCVCVCVCVCVSTTSLSIHPFHDGYRLLPYLGNVNTSAMNIEVQVSFQINVCIGFFGGCIFKNEISVSYNSYIFSFWETSRLFSCVAQIYIPTNRVKGFVSFHTHQNLLLVLVCY